jgi:hypothetical protein
MGPAGPAGALSQEQTDEIHNAVSKVRDDGRRGAATAIAMGTASMPTATGRTSYVLNIAAYAGEQAIGGSLMHRLDTQNPFAITLGLARGRSRSMAVRVGVAGEF